MEGLIYEVFDPLPRQGPGSEVSTGRALRCMRGLPDRPRILDVGCGSGAQTIALARSLPAEIVAVDNHAPYLVTVRERAVRAAVQERVRCVEGDMAALEFEAGSFDVIWSEGAIYNMGFERGLRRWRPLLVPGGYLAVTEISWLREQRATDTRSFWARDYPAMADVASNLATLESCGYRLQDHFVLPESDWWDEFYRPLEERVRALRPAWDGDDEATRFLDTVDREIDLYRRRSKEYGYVFYVARRRD